MTSTAQPITYETLLAAFLATNGDHPATYTIFHSVAVRLGIDVPPKIAPWEAAYQAWIAPWSTGVDVVSADAFKAGVEWAVRRALLTPEQRRSIMGDER